MYTRILLPLLAVSIVYLPSASAEDTLRADIPTLDTRVPTKKAPLSGKVSVEQAHIPTEVHKPATTASNVPAALPPKTVAPQVRPVAPKVVAAPTRPVPVTVPVHPAAAPQHSNPLNGFANDFGGNPMQGMMDHRHRHMRGFVGYNPYAMQMQLQAQAQAQKPKWTNPDDAPYRWGQCGTGGYYDTTGIYKGPMVWGDKLAALGGRFYDGTPVPKGPVQINAMGHIWWQNKLSQNFVKREDLRKQGFNE